MARDTIQVKRDVGSWMIVRSMLSYVWPKDKPGMRLRVILAVGLLIGAKVGDVYLESFHNDVTK